MLQNLTWTVSFSPDVGVIVQKKKKHNITTPPRWFRDDFCPAAPRTRPLAAQPSSSRFIVQPPEGGDAHRFQAPEHSRGTFIGTFSLTHRQGTGRRSRSGTFSAPYHHRAWPHRTYMFVFSVRCCTTRHGHHGFVFTWPRLCAFPRTPWTKAEIAGTCTFIWSKINHFSQRNVEENH